MHFAFFEAGNVQTSCDSQLGYRLKSRSMLKLNIEVQPKHLQYCFCKEVFTRFLTLFGFEMVIFSTTNKLLIGTTKLSGLLLERMVKVVRNAQNVPSNC